jgi:hypothetical protein
MRTSPRPQGWLRNIDEMLGLAPQLSLEALRGDLRGQKLQEIAAASSSDVGGDAAAQRRAVATIGIQLAVAARGAAAGHGRQAMLNQRRARRRPLSVSGGV